MFGKKDEPTGKPRAAGGLMCPEFKRDVSEVCHKCKFYLCAEQRDEKGHVVRADWECGILAPAVLLSQLNALMGDIHRKIDGQGRALEGFRNELARFTESSTKTNVAAVAAALSHVEQRERLAELLPPVRSAT